MYVLLPRQHDQAVNRVNDVVILQDTLISLYPLRRPVVDENNGRSVDVPQRFQRDRDAEAAIHQDDVDGWLGCVTGAAITARRVAGQAPYSVDVIGEAPAVGVVGGVAPVAWERRKRG